MLKKIRLLIMGILVCSSLYASEKDDIKFLDELFIQKKYSLALEESQKFIATYPKSKYLKNVMIRMGQVYYLEGRYHESIQMLNNSLKTLKLKTDEKNMIYFYLTKSYLGLKDFATAKKAASLIDQEKEGKYVYEDALLEIGKGYIEVGDYLKAQDELTNVLKLGGKKYGEIVLNLALASYNNGQYIKTIVYLDEYYQGKVTGSNDLVNYLYGSAYYKTDENKKALDYFKKVITESPNSSYSELSLLTMIEIYLKTGDMGEAEKLLSSLQSDKETSDKILASFGNHYLVKGDNKKALEYYNKITTENLEALYGSALAEFQLKDYKPSLEKFKKLEKTKYSKESIYYQFAIEYANKDYDWVLTNKNKIEKLDLTKNEKISLNSFIAASAFNKGQFDLAEEFYEKNYKLDSNKENLYKLIVTSARNKDTEKVFSLMDIYNKNYPADQEYKKELTIILATQYINEKNIDKGIELYKNYLSKERDDEIISNLVDVMIADKRYKEVMEYLNIQDSSDENTYLKGIATMGMGKYDEAEIYFSQLISNEKVNLGVKEKARYNAIKNYFLWERYDNVITLGEEYLAGNNVYNLEDVVDKLAISYFRIDNLDKAREYFEKLKLISGMEDYAQFQIGETYYTEKNYLKAAEAYKIVSETAKSNSYKEKGAYWELSSLYLMKNTDEFQIKSQNFLNNYPNSSLKENVYLMEGELFGIQGNSEESLKVYEKLYNETQDLILKEKALTKLIDLNRLNKNFQKELEWINKITNTDKKSYYTAKYLQDQNKPEEAKVELEKLLVSDSYKDFANIGLGDYYYNTKDYVKAKENYNNVINLENSRYKDKALFQMANIQLEEGDTKGAIRNYTKLYVLYPSSEYYLESQIRIAESYEKGNEVEEAIKQYEELLKTSSKNKDYFLEKLIYLNLKLENTKEAEKYYKQLKKANISLSEKYKNFFEGGENI